MVAPRPRWTPDAAVIDLEDTVPPDAEATARDLAVAAALMARAGPAGGAQ